MEWWEGKLNHAEGLRISNALHSFCLIIPASQTSTTPIGAKPLNSYPPSALNFIRILPRRGIRMILGYNGIVGPE